MEDRETARMRKYGESKRLELWWQLYRTSLPVWDLENFRPMEFCWHECTKFKVFTTERFLLSSSGFRHRVFCQVNTKWFGRIFWFHIQCRRRQKHHQEFCDPARGYPISHDSHYNMTKPKYFYDLYSFLRFGWKCLCVLGASDCEEEIQLTQTRKLVFVPK